MNIEDLKLGEYTTASALGRKLGVSYSTVRRWESKRLLIAAAPGIYLKKNIIIFLKQNPKYIAEKNVNWDFVDKIPGIVERLLPDWKILLDFYQKEDIISEVQIRLARRKTRPQYLFLSVRGILYELWELQKNNPLNNPLRLKD